MKAKDYMTKFGEALISPYLPETWGMKPAEQILKEANETRDIVFCEFSLEATRFRDSRKAKTRSAFEGIGRELNQKWNALCDLLEAKCGKSHLERNFFWQEFIAERVMVLPREKKEEDSPKGKKKHKWNTTRLTPEDTRLLDSLSTPQGDLD